MASTVPLPVGCRMLTVHIAGSKSSWGRKASAPYKNGGSLRQAVTARQPLKFAPPTLLSRSFCGRQLFNQQSGQPANGADLGQVGGIDADPRFGLDPGAQFQGTQRVQTVLGKRPVRIDAATQDQADLLGE